MPTPDPTNLPFYPAYCFRPLSLTYNEWARLTAADVHALKERSEFEGQQTYFHLNHPIRWIRLVGVVVDFEAYANRFIMVLDDSSGANIEVTCGRTPPPKQDAYLKTPEVPTPSTKPLRMIGNTAQGGTVDLTGVDIGSIVKVKGGIGCFRGEKQMALERLTFVRTANEESEAWAQCAAFRRNILDKPWEITDQDQLRAKRRADGKEERRRARGEQKKKARLLEDAQKLRKRKELRQAHDNDGQVRREKGMVREDCHAERRMRPEAKARIRKT